MEVSSTSWDYAEMGRQRIPLRNLRAIGLDQVPDTAEQTYAVQLWARRTSGAADIYFDCFCPVPLDEGWLKAWDFDLPAATAVYWIVGRGPIGEMQAVVYTTAGAMTYAASHASADWHLPVGDGRLYMVYAGASAHDLTLGFEVDDLLYYERWANLRGGE